MPNKPLTLCSGEELHRAFGGHGSPRKSKPTGGLVSGIADPILWKKQEILRRSLRLATINKRRKTLAAVRGKRFERLDFKPCYRRWAEYMGAKASTLNKNDYTTKPRLVCKPDRFVYELLIGLMPICSFTDGGEAYETQQSFIAHGFESTEIRQIDLSQQIKEQANVLSFC